LTDMNKQYEVEGQQFTLANLQMMDFGQIEAVEPGMPRFPKGIYEWEVESSAMDEIFGVLGIRNKLRCANVVAFEDPSINPADWIGKVHEENIRLWVTDGATPTQQDLLRMFGVQKDLMEKTGYQVVGNVQQALQGWTGTRFNCEMNVVPGRKDPSKRYHNLNIFGIVPVVTQQAQPAGQQVPTLNMAGATG